MGGVQLLLMSSTLQDLSHHLTTNIKHRNTSLSVIFLKITVEVVEITFGQTIQEA